MKFLVTTVEIIFLLYYSNAIKVDKKAETNSELKAQQITTPTAPLTSFAPTVPGMSGVQQIKPLILNTTESIDTTNSMREVLRTWDLKLTDKQLLEIAQDMMKGEETLITPDSKRSFLHFFVNMFTYCDTNKNNALEYNEFELCMKNDTYLRALQPPPERYSAYREHSAANPTGFYTMIFNTVDTLEDKSINFYEYMLLRLFAFSWKKCSVMGPYIEEIAFECAIDISSGGNTLSRSTYKKLYYIATEIADNENIRNIDFITYLNVGLSARLYFKINNKQDTDVTKREMTLALDSNILPARYTTDVVDNFFRLTGETDKPDGGLDLVSFVFYDFFLSLFDSAIAQRKSHLNSDEFLKVIDNYLFPNRTKSEVELAPQNELTPTSLNQFTYMNLTNFGSEENHFLKTYASFLEKDNLLTLTNSGTFTKLRFNAKKTYTEVFNIIDSDSDGWINFYDFGEFIQIAYLYSIFDVYNKGRIIASELKDKFSNYYDIPIISDSLRNRAKRFSLLPKDIYVDVKTTILLLRLEDIVQSLTRRTDPTLIYEYELKNVLAAVNMKFVPDQLLNQCLRGTDADKIPQYDWECSFIKAITDMLKYYESSYALIQTKSKGFNLQNTIFVNVDPNIS
jgi:hypothetical protein